MTSRQINRQQRRHHATISYNSNVCCRLLGAVYEESFQGRYNKTNDIQAANACPPLPHHQSTSETWQVKGAKRDDFDNDAALPVTHKYMCK
ncbi:unnamed protein product [Ceratitis capitata]|uniref:(Mediterranean fruit fly) hypothetical protein n=1 Tax=Ceratitis capitata TaxID=7213 RepID=A0A811V202_CERCA|nr:unnamed protein product [Ceratitis capitata]